MKELEELGERVEALWKAENYDEELLPAIAKRALGEADLPSRISAWDVLEWTVSKDHLPNQRDLHGSFGDPPITVFTFPRFHVDVYFWFEGTTTRHQHGFCGAFQVLHGSSIHGWYEFEPRKKVNTFAQVGDLRLRSCELLNVGDIQEIWSGSRYIHSLFHLEQPSATIVVRTVRSPLDLPQFNYLKPCLAIDPFFEEPSTVKKIQAAAALFRARRPEADEILEGYLRASDFQTSYMILDAMRRVIPSGFDQVFDIATASDRIGRFLDVVAEVHPDLGEVLPDVFAYADRTESIVRQRSFVTEPEHRFFLALLLNVEGKDNVFSLVSERFPGADPLEKVLDWVSELANTRVMGLNVPNALGVAGFGDADVILLENMLNGMPDDENATEFTLSFGADDPDASAKTAMEKIGAIRNANVFKPLLK